MIRTPIGGWWLKSIVLNGREILDAPLDLRQSSADAVVTVSDRATEITGTVLGAGGTPRSDQFVVIFSRNKAHWFLNSRRVIGIRPDQEGRYRIRNLPPGDYLIALADLDQGEWFDPEILDGLAAGATRITLGENEQKKHDLQALNP